MNDYDHINQLIKMNADRITELEGYLFEILSHFFVSGVGKVVIYDGEITPKRLIEIGEGLGVEASSEITAIAGP